jgi:hypothetical protein
MQSLVWTLALALLIPTAVEARGPAIAQTFPPNVVKVPCRDMGDGRILIDGLYLPDGFVNGKSTYKIIHTRPTSMQGEWANRVCTLKLK